MLIFIIDKCEIILSKYPNIINAIIAIGTIVAVCVSLYYSQLRLRPRLKAHCWLSEIYSSDMQNNLYCKSDKVYITLSITNSGLIPVFLQYCSCFVWQLPFYKYVLLQQPIYPQFLNKDFELLPHKTCTFLLCEYEIFIDKIIEILKSNRLPLWLIYFLSFKIITSDNYFIYAKINKEIKKNLITDVKARINNHNN